MASKDNKDPLQVNLSFTVRTGDTPEQTHELLDNHSVPMVNSVFQYRERMAGFLAMSLVRVALRQPDMVRTLLPLLRPTRQRK